MNREEIVQKCSAALWNAEQSRETIDLLSAAFPQLTEQDAYAIQRATLARRGAAPVGFKLGYTSAAMRQQMGIDHPNYGVLTIDHQVDDEGGLVDASRLIHPLVEPEIALLVGRDITGTGHTRSDIARYVDAVMPALEIVDTRYHDYEFSAVDNISDNSSSARYVTGRPMLPGHAGDLRLCGVLVWSQGRVLDQGLGANALGDPLLALAWLANFVAAEGASVREGSVVLTGGLTRAHVAKSNTSFVAEFGGLGTVRAHFG